MFFYLIVVPFLNIYLFSKGLFLFFPKFINLNEKIFFLLYFNVYENYIIRWSGTTQTTGSNPLQKQSAKQYQQGITYNVKIYSRIFFGRHFKYSIKRPAYFFMITILMFPTSQIHILFMKFFPGQTRIKASVFHLILINTFPLGVCQFFFSHPLRIENTQENLCMF